MKLTAREAATVIAALNLWETTTLNRDELDPWLRSIAPLIDAEIEALRQKLLAPVETPPRAPGDGWYRVRWEVDAFAPTPRLAAQAALVMQRDPESIATLFEVFDRDGVRTDVDLLDDRDDGEVAA